MLRRRALARCAARAWPMVTGGFGSVEDSNSPVSVNAEVAPDRTTVDVPTFTFDEAEEGEPSVESKARHAEERAVEEAAEAMRKMDPRAPMQRAADACNDLRGSWDRSIAARSPR